MSRLVRQVHTIVCLHFLLFLAGALRAPAQEFRGSLLVTIQDSSGGRIPGADVSLTLDKIGTTRSAKSNARGEVRFDALQPGTYAISADATGFKGTTAAVVVAVSSQPTLGITLVPETVLETVQVYDRGPSLASQPIETTSSTVKTVITSADLDEVPLSARTFANISLLAPFT
ncbi:MAG TPA: carboxypeptidase-like regulatory domain-containing protein, partial [Candidatus Acidoferrum sp.]